MILLIASICGLVVAVILMLIYAGFFYMNYTATAKLDRLKTANAQLSNVTKDLQVYKRKQEQLEKQKDLIENLQEMQIDWPELFNDVAMLLPNEVWLTDIKAEIPAADVIMKAGAAPSQTETNSILLTGYSLNGQNGVAKTLTRLADVPSIRNVMLNYSQESNYGQRRMTQFEIKAEIILPKALTEVKAAPAGGGS